MRRFIRFQKLFVDKYEKYIYNSIVTGGDGFMKNRNIFNLFAAFLVFTALACSMTGDSFLPYAHIWSYGILFVAFIVFLFSALRISKNSRFALAAGKSDKSTSSNCASKIRFSDVAANEQALSSLMELTDFLKHPEKYASLGARIPRGILLYGPPGTGKTLLARALAGEAGVPFLAVSGSDFVEMYAGVGARRVRDVFMRARKMKKCVIFIDEIDTLGKARGVNSSDERDQTLNQLLNEMSGFRPSDGIIVIAATNRMEIMDAALLRPGRFDRRIEVGMPCREARESILRLHAQNKPLAENVDLRALAGITAFFSGASLENLLNEAAIRAARRNSPVIENEDIDRAYTAVTAGEDGKSHAATADNRAIALHEAGHAVVLRMLDNHCTIRRISILPASGGAAGYNLTLPEEKSLFTKQELKNKITVLLAGRAAEEIALGENGITTGASNDLERAASIAAAMTTSLGMGAHPAVCESALGGSTGGRECAYGPREILSECYDRAKELLLYASDALFDLTQTLLNRESLSSEEIDRFFNAHTAAMSNESDLSA